MAKLRVYPRKQFAMSSTMPRNILEWLDRKGLDVRKITPKEQEIYEDQMMKEEKEKWYLSHDQQGNYFLIKNPITRDWYRDDEGYSWIKHTMPVLILLTEQAEKAKRNRKYKQNMW